MNGTALRLIGRAATRRALVGLVAVPATLVLLAGCEPFSGQGTVTVHGGPAASAPVTSSASGTTNSGSTTTSGQSGTTSGPTGTKTGQTGSKSGQSGTTSGSTSPGCAPGGVTIPAGAGTARTADLDGDGKADTIWLADVGSKRELGVRTASGAGFSTVFQSAAPESAYAVANTLAGGTPIVLLNPGREATLYAVVGCHLVATGNAQGQQYTFDQGFTGYGTGAGCPVIGSERRLVGYDAVSNSSGSTFKVTRTTIDVSDGGRTASNGPTVVLGTNLPSSSATVKLAHEVGCGSAQAAYEPQM